MTRRLPALLLCCLLALSVGLAACGGGDEDVDELLAQTFGGEGDDVKSGRLAANLRINAQGLENLQGPIALRLNGPFQSTKAGELPRFDFGVAVEAGGQALQVGAVSTGDKGFVRFQDQAYAVGDELFKQFKDGYAEQAKCNQEKGSGGVSFRTLGIDPRRWLRDSSREGTEEVGGAETIHISSAIDVPKFLEDVNRVLGRADLRQEDPCAEKTDAQPEQTPTRKLSAEDRKLIGEAVKDARIDVWTGEEDKILRRLNVTLKFDVPEERRKKANGLTSGDVRFDLTIGRVNEDQAIKAPADTQPLETLLERFGGQIPGLGGAGAGAQDGAGAAPEASGSSSSKYQQCLADAGQDVTKLQACADLVGS